MSLFCIFTDWKSVPKMNIAPLSHILFQQSLVLNRAMQAEKERLEIAKILLNLSKALPLNNQRSDREVANSLLNLSTKAENNQASSSDYNHEYIEDNSAGPVSIINI